MKWLSKFDSDAAPTEHSRRDWLCSSIAGALAAVTVQSAAPGWLAAAPATKVQDMLIDAHSHVWSPDTDKWPLAKGQTRSDLKPPSFTPEELLKLAEPEGVGRVVLIQHSTYHAFDNAYLIDCARRFPERFVVVGMLDDTQPHPDVKLRELLAHRVRGLRITPRVRGKTWLEGPGMAALWKCGAETGQAMCCLIDPSDLPGVSAMCQQHPETPVVIDHFARIGADGTIRDTDLTNLCGLAKHKRVAVKISAYYALGKKQPPYDDLAPMIRRVLDAFGPERCMWASDSPYQVQGDHTYRASIALIRDRLEGLSAGDREWLLRKTAEKVYFASLLSG